MRRWLFNFFMRHPVGGGIAMVVVGLFVITLAFNEAARYAEFAGGSRVVGRVISARHDPERKPSDAALIEWLSRGHTHRALVEIHTRPFDAVSNPDPLRDFPPGSKLALVISKSNPDAAVDAEVLSAAGIVDVAGKPAMSNLLYIGLLFIGLGVLLVLLRNLFAPSS